MQFRTQAFPFCPVDSANVGPGTLNPFSAPIQTLADWFWGVKLWTLEFVTDYGTFTFTDIQFADTDVGPISNERQLICTGKLWTASGHSEIQWEMHLFTQRGVSGDAIGAAQPPEESNPESPDLGHWLTDAIRYDQGFYYPQFLLRFDADASPLNFSTWGGDSPPYDHSAHTLDFAGHPVALYSSDETNFIAASLAPQEWWPYAPESDPALPIYDPIDGHQLRPNTVSD
jgi:hypothetical protein